MKCWSSVSSRCWEIAKKVKKCQFVFKTVAVSEEVADQFKRRIENKFSLNGLSPSEHLIFIDYLEEDDYKNFKFYEKKLQQAFTAKKDLLLGKEAVDNPLDTSEDRRLKDRKRNPTSKGPKKL